MGASLIVVADGKLMGEVGLRGDRLSFRYEKEWQDSESAFPLSLSMPLIAREHGHRVVEAFLWGLLPDNDAVLDRWGRRFRVSARNPFRLIENVGEDCAGAVQFVRPERMAENLDVHTKPKVSWMTDGELNERIAAVIADASATRLGSDTGQFSLAGAQPKLALYYHAKKRRWGVPEGRTPTTHILKPATGTFDGQVENEHFCLSLAAELGFPTARSRIMICGNTPVIVLERYDRLEQAGFVQRIHQEDFCQAAGIRPQEKYQNQGGPSPKMVSEILRTFSSSPEEDVWRFVDTLIFHWLTAAPDAHGKNYSILIAAGGRARLAPLYDLASALPYPQQILPRKATMAMKIGSNYGIQKISLRDWQRFARELRLSPGEVFDRISDLADRLPQGAATVSARFHKEGIRHPVISRITGQLEQHIARCRKMLSPGV